MAANLAAALRLLLITDDRLLAGRDPLAACRDAVAGGVSAVQLRSKSTASRELMSIARRLVAELPVPVFVNDRLDVALAAGAAGGHLGTDDLSPELAARIIPPGFWLGASVGNADEAVRAATASYWGIGPFRVTRTKEDAGAALGTDGIARLLALADQRPCVAIGGVRPGDLPALRDLGLTGVAVASGILAAADIQRAAAAYRWD